MSLDDEACYIHTTPHLSIKVVNPISHPVTAALDIVGPSGLHSSRVEVQDRLADDGNMLIECDPYRHDVSGSVYTSAVWTRDVNHLGGERRVLIVRSSRIHLKASLAHKEVL